MRVFASELSKCRVKKSLYGWLAVLFGFISFIVFPLLWVFKAPIEKSDIDFVREYVTYRLNYTPKTVNDAFFSKLQYTFPLYKETVKDEITYIKTSHIYQMFIPKNVIKEKEVPKFKVLGYLVKWQCNASSCEKIDEGIATAFISMPKKYKFILEELK